MQVQKKHGLDQVINDPLGRNKLKHQSLIEVNCQIRWNSNGGPKISTAEIH